MHTNTTQAKYIGWKARETISVYKKATVIGNTSRGVFLQFGRKWIVFLSYEKWKGPLTINIIGSPLTVETGFSATVQDNPLCIEIHNEQTAIVARIDLAKAQEFAHTNFPHSSKNVSLDCRYEKLISAYDRRIAQAEASESANKAKMALQQAEELTELSAPPSRSDSSPEVHFYSGDEQSQQDPNTSHWKEADNCLGSRISNAETGRSVASLGATVAHAGAKLAAEGAKLARAGAKATSSRVRLNTKDPVLTNARSIASRAREMALVARQAVEVAKAAATSARIAEMNARAAIAQGQWARCRALLTICEHVHKPSAMRYLLDSPGLPDFTSIIGMGNGLTPSGDDVLAGFLLTRARSKQLSTLEPIDTPEIKAIDSLLNLSQLEQQAKSEQVAKQILSQALDGSSSGESLISNSSEGEKVAETVTSIPFSRLIASDKEHLAQDLEEEKQVSRLRQLVPKATTTLSANLIELASMGQADERLISLSNHILSGTPLSLDFLSWGAHSGMDTLIGICLFAREQAQRSQCFSDLMHKPNAQKPNPKE